MSILEQLSTGKATTTQALEICDALEPVELNFMTGHWRGNGFHTGHPMDGLLEAYHWYGKSFDDPDNVHPLLFSTRRGARAAINPVFMGPALGMMKNLPRSPMAGRLFQLAMPLFTTSRSRARLRMTSYRGVSSATMIYDQLPINDVFRRIDEDTVFGIMDFKHMDHPFFFVLHRSPGNRRAAVHNENVHSL